MVQPVYVYREGILRELARHGLCPQEHTPPDFVREALNDLYLYEIRRLRDRLKSGVFPKQEYAKRVEALRLLYRVLGVPLDRWLISQTSESTSAKDFRNHTGAR